MIFLVSKDDNKFVLWPIYFDSTATRPWRRVPRDLAIPQPTAEEVARAAQSLRMQPILETDAPHPARWWHGGRVLVDARGSKSVLVRQIGEKLKQHRADAAVRDAATKKQK